MRERNPNAPDGSTRPVATLNGTLATTRWIVSILENHGSGWLGGRAEGLAALPRRVGRAGGAGGRRLMLIALDIDSTIIDWSENLSERVEAAIRGVVEAGHDVVLATGRSLWGTTEVLQRLRP